MKRTGAEVAAAFRRQRLADWVVDFKRAWWLAALLLALLVFSLVNESAPRRSLGIEVGVVVGMGLAETDAGSFPYAMLEMPGGANARVFVPRSVVLTEGALVRVEVFERTWPWKRRTYRFVGPARSEHPPQAQSP